MLYAKQLKFIPRIQYRLLIAQIRENCFMQANLILMKDWQLEYNEILNIDSTHSTALYNLGRLNSEYFLKFHNAGNEGQ